jgi:hypothetical protein
MQPLGLSREGERPRELSHPHESGHPGLLPPPRQSFWRALLRWRCQRHAPFQDSKQNNKRK